MGVADEVTVVVSVEGLVADGEGMSVMERVSSGSWSSKPSEVDIWRKRPWVVVVESLGYWSVWIAWREIEG